MGYLRKTGVSFELIEFQSGGRTVQGGIFVPDPKLFHEPGTAVVLVHGVEGYWYAGPTMFLGCYLAESGYAALAYNGAHSERAFEPRNSRLRWRKLVLPLLLLELADSRTSFSP